MTPYIAALDAAKNFTDPLAQSALLGGLAKAQAERGLVDAALSSVALISNRAEKRGVLLHLAIESAQSGDVKNRTKNLFRYVKALLEFDPTQKSVVGRLADSLLDVGDAESVEAALKLLEMVDKPFDSDRFRYDFGAKLLGTSFDGAIDAAKKIFDGIENADYQDWGRLALAKRLAALDRWPEAETIADSFSLGRRRCWAFFELSRLAERNLARKFLEHATEILMEMPIDATEPAGIEALAIQLRILGKAVYRSDYDEAAEWGARLLERGEAAAAAVPIVQQRFRAQYLLAKTLRELNLLDSVRNYVNPKEIDRSKLNALDRSRVWQYYAEAVENGEKSTAWIEAIRSASSNLKENGVTDQFAQAERIVEMLRRFSVSDRNLPASGDPRLDAVRLSAEEFEEYYFSPFSTDDCGC